MSPVQGVAVLQLPRTWASMLAAACATPRLPVSARPSVTAGFICPPDRCPVAKASTAHERAKLITSLFAGRELAALGARDSNPSR